MAQVRYFLAICEERSFTRAARRCGVKQPSLTRAMKALERELGRPLFRRSAKGAELTPAGAEVAPLFASIARCVEAIKQTPAQTRVNDHKPEGVEGDGAGEPGRAV